MKEQLITHLLDRFLEMPELMQFGILLILGIGSGGIAFSYIKNRLDGYY